MARTYRGKKYRSASKIQALFRGFKARKRKRTTTRHSSRRGTAVANVRLSSRGKQTLKQRVKVLEGNASKHWDLTSTPDDPTKNITWNGLTYTGMPATDPRNAFKGLLAIQGMGSDAGGGTMMPLTSGRFTAVNENVRENSTIFVTKARLRGLIVGKVPAVLQNFTPAATGETSVSDTALAGCSRQKIWLVVLRDKRPSLVDANGTSTQNPPEAGGSGKSPVESLSMVTSTGGHISLQTHGYSNFLRSYESTRFQPVFSKAYELTANSPIKYFDVTIDINKKLQYSEIALAASNNKAPLNYNLYVYLLAARQPPNFPDAQMIKPTLINWSSRVYFKDA